MESKLTTKDILKIIAGGTIILSSLLLPGLPQALLKTQRAWKNINKRDLGRIIKRLEKQQMISINDSGNKIVIGITEKGKKRLLEYDFEKIQLKAQKREGKWRLIIFDIPEGKKSAREMFRRKLIQLGFIRLQDSVFASAFPCKNEIDFLANYLEISDFVTLASLHKIERGEQLSFQKYQDLS